MKRISFSVKILWVKTDYLHPTNRGGQIRTLETVRRLHRRHELHYIAFDDPSLPEGPRRAAEYCSEHFAVPHAVPEKKLTSPAFVGQLAAGLLSPLPVAVNRWRSPVMRREIEKLQARYRYDAVVCDFLFPAPNIPQLNRAVLFQHNVEAQIWRRHVAQASNPIKRAYFQLQANRMHAYEREVCRKARRVIAVSEGDAQQMRELYGAGDVHHVDTGVDTDFFAPPRNNSTSASSDTRADLVFLGSMDWMPNIDGMQWFVREILPLIHARRPDTTVAIVGRKPGPEIMALAGGKVHVTGTVPDVRPWLWGGKLSIVPLRIGGGTRLKIYESMAAGIGVVSTAIGAEGLEVHDGANILLADTPADFARRCVELLDDSPRRAAIADRAAAMVRDKYSWDSVTGQFERLLAIS
jgi:glycosyltransferase involved in cell wall biosynthesis